MTSDAVAPDPYGHAQGRASPGHRESPDAGLITLSGASMRIPGGLLCGSDASAQELLPNVPHTHLRASESSGRKPVVKRDLPAARLPDPVLACKSMKCEKAVIPQCPAAKILDTADFVFENELPFFAHENCSAAEPHMAAGTLPLRLTAGIRRATLTGSSMRDA